MYPPGHPAAGAGLDPFLAAAAPLLADGRVSIAVGRTRLVVAVGPLPPNEYEAAWLAARLFDREVASLVIEPDLDALEAGTLIRWLAQPADEARDGLPALSTMRLARFDGSTVRFREDETSTASASDEAVWRALTAPLTAAYGVSDPGAWADDPALLADRIREAIQSSEGTGIADLAARLLDLHTRAMDAGEERAMATRRLAALVAHLQPELRGSLISAGADDDPAKLLLLEEILDSLPSATVAAIIGGLRLDDRPATAAFTRFLQKLVRLSLADPALHDAIDSRLGAGGLAPELFARGPTPVPDRNPGPPGDDIDRQAVPDEYRARLTAMARNASLETNASSGAPSATASNLPDAAATRAVVLRIALLQADRSPDSEEAEAYWRFLLKEAARARAASEIDFLSAVADKALRLAAPGSHASADLRVVLGEVHRFLGEAESVRLAIEHLLHASADSGGAPHVLLAAGGAPAAQEALRWIREAANRAAAGRVLAALTRFEDGTFRQVVLPGIAVTPGLAELFPLAIDQVESSRAIELAAFAATLDDPAVRLVAVLWLSSAQLSSGKRHWFLRRALDDPDPRVVEVGVTAAAGDDSAVATDALLYFVSRRGPAAWAGLQVRALGALRMDRAAVVQPLARVLGSRGLACSGRARQISVAMAAALNRSPFPEGRVAARAWRWSPAGILSLLLFTRPPA